MNYKIREFLNNFKPRRFLESIKNLIVWFPIIWKDRQWDYIYLLIILKFKLKLMELYFRTTNITTDSKEISKAISECKEILDRLIENDYLSDDILKIPNTEENKKKILEAMRLEAEQYNADMHNVFLKIAKEIQNWWD